MAYEAAALERLCQVVRIRGFRVARMAVERVDDQLDIQLILEGTRSIEMLKSQLEKLHTVAEVTLPRQPEAVGERERATLASV
jgi:acetolactate synthase II small subunit